MSDDSARVAEGAPRAHLALVAAAVTVLPLVFWAESFRPFVGPKLLAALALGSLAVPLLAVGPGIERLGRAALVAFGAYVLAYAVATAFSLDPIVSLVGDARRGMGFATRLSLIAVALVAAAGCAGRPDAIRFVLRLVLAVCALESVYLLLQAYRLDPFVDQALLEQTSRAGVVELRVVGTLGHPNFVGHLLLFGIGAAVALTGLERSNLGRLIAYVGGFVTALGVVAAGARGAWVGLAAQIALATLYALRTGVSRRLVLGASAILLLAAATTALVARGPLAEQLATRVEAFRTDNLTGSGRTILWRDSVPMFGQYALHGTGPEVFARAFLSYQSADLARAEPYAVYDSTHNVILDAAIVAGVGGLASLLGLLGVAFAALVRASRCGSAPLAALGIGLGLVGYLVDGMFVFDTIATATFFYLFVGLAIAHSAIAANATSGAGPKVAWRSVLAAVLLLAAGWALWPRLWRVWRSDAQMATADRRAATGAVSEAIAFAKAAVENARALGLVPEQRRLLVRIYARVGDDSRAPTDGERLLLEEGRAEAVRALEHSTAPHLVFAELGNLSLRLADIPGGERAFREATSVAPNYWYAHARLAHLLSVRGDGEAARIEAARALALNPESDLVKDLIRRLEAE